MHEIGYQVGARMQELLTFRDKNAKRETKLLSVLSYISSTMWKQMFGKAAELERSTASEHEYMIVECVSLCSVVPSPSLPHTLSQILNLIKTSKTKRPDW